MWWTTLLFAIVMVLLVYSHVRARSEGRVGTEILCHRADDARARGRLRVVTGSRVLEIRNDAVALDVQGAPEIAPSNDGIVRVGGVAPNALLEKIGVRRVIKELRLEPAAG